MRNRGELAEGWYDPSTFQKATASSSKLGGKSRDVTLPSPSRGRGRQENDPREQDLNDYSDASVGPTLPGQDESRSRGGYKGPSIPNKQDLELKRGI